MKTLNISILNKVATYHQRDGAIVCGNSDYLVMFNLDSEWTSLTGRIARFTWNGGFVDVPLPDGSSDTVGVAAPVIDNATQVEVGIYAEYGAGFVRTTTPAVIPCRASVRDGRPVEHIPTVEAATIAGRIADAEQTLTDHEKRLDVLEAGGTGGSGSGKIYKHDILLKYDQGTYTHFGFIYLTFVSSSAAKITTLKGLLESPACAANYLQFACADHHVDDLDTSASAARVRKVYVEATGLDVHYDLNDTSGIVNHSVNQVLITDTVTEV